MPSQKSEGKLLLEFLRARTNHPKRSVAFVLYFVFVIVLAGLVSNFLGLISTIDVNKPIDYDATSLALMGYSLILLCSSAIEFIFIRFHDDEKFDEIRNAISMLGISTLIVGVLLAYLVFIVSVGWIKVFISLLMTLGSLYMWWVSNARTLTVLKNRPPKVSTTTGGGVPISTLQISGNIPSNFTT